VPRRLIHAFFVDALVTDRPKRAISSQSIWLLIAMMISAPILAWIQAAVNGNADMMHLDKF
jgi:hypothetical protein